MNTNDSKPVNLSLEAGSKKILYQFRKEASRLSKISWILFVFIIMFVICCFWNIKSCQTYRAATLFSYNKSNNIDAIILEPDTSGLNIGEQIVVRFESNGNNISLTATIISLHRLTSKKTVIGIEFMQNRTIDLQNANSNITIYGSEERLLKSLYKSFITQ